MNTGETEADHSDEPQAWDCEHPPKWGGRWGTEVSGAPQGVRSASTGASDFQPPDCKRLCLGEPPALPSFVT